MRFQVSMGFDLHERRTIQKGAATLRLIDDSVGADRFEELSKAVRLCQEQGNGLRVKHVQLAIQAFEALRGELVRQSEWVLTDWGFEAVESHPRRTGPGAPLAYKVRSPAVGLVADPPIHVAQMAELRKSQVVDVDDALELLRNAMKKVKALQGVVEVFDSEEDADADE